jgi:hypothetical protein
MRFPAGVAAQAIADTDDRILFCSLEISLNSVRCPEYCVQRDVFASSHETIELGLRAEKRINREFSCSPGIDAFDATCQSVHGFLPGNEGVCCP